MPIETRKLKLYELLNTDNGKSELVIWNGNNVVTMDDLNLGGGGGLTLGPATNSFNGTTLAAAQAARDTYANANADWLAAYDANPSLVVILTYTTDTSYSARRNNAWYNVTPILAVRGPSLSEYYLRNVIYNPATNTLEDGVINGIEADEIENAALFYFIVPTDIDRDDSDLNIELPHVTSALLSTTGQSVSARDLTPGELLHIGRFYHRPNWELRLESHLDPRPQDYRIVFSRGDPTTDTLTAASLADSDYTAVSPLDSGRIDLNSLDNENTNSPYWVGVPVDAPDLAGDFIVTDFALLFEKVADILAYNGVDYKWWKTLNDGLQNPAYLYVDPDAVFTQGEY